MHRRLIAAYILGSLIDTTSFPAQARPPESTCQSALLEAEKAMANVSELETKVALLREYRAYSWRSVRENLAYLDEYETKKASLVAEIDKAIASLNRFYTILKRCSQR